ncbi:hypothetical protein [Clostridium cibarium]|uniref:GIY-YIG domain-containing protein n=1 Tax=Clostridium cibarium TaxID=2762247 RepID=A0ABR8PZ90_9CLOT|nr:hypothetical protein [Clostridium cibarium]MBD7913484.1 hypothetical protein [Clostridium cibarium]
MRKYLFPIKQFEYSQYLLEVFLVECEKELLNSETIKEILYPKDIKKETWKTFSDQILKDNKRILDYVQNRDGIYAIHIKRKKTDEWLLRYIGQKGKNSKDRLKSHLVTKHDKTGSKLEKVQESVVNGWKIGVSFIEINPGSMRLSVEELLIEKNSIQLEWNKRSKNR